VLLERLSHAKWLHDEISVTMRVKEKGETEREIEGLSWKKIVDTDPLWWDNINISAANIL
jgi:hypothetical protein